MTDSMMTTMSGSPVDKISPHAEPTDVCDTPLQPKDGQCAFYVLRKKRFCRFPPHSGKRYCAEHAVFAGVDLGRKRVQCPLNPKHTCYEDSLHKHLKKCVKMAKNINIYYEEGINAGDADGDDVPEQKFTVKQATREEVLEFIKRVNQLHKEYIGDITLEDLTHESLKEELSAPSYGFKVMRQRRQQASLIGHLQQMGFLTDGLCYVELGAGRGEFAHWVQLAMDTCNDSSFVLVDKGTCRYKFDSFHKGEHQGPTFERLQVNLADINLGKVPSISVSKRPVLGMGKHLCGDATDLALRCLTQTLTVGPAEHNSCNSRVPLEGLAIALCCHHRCSWPSYVGKPFIREQCGMSVAEFQLLSNMTSWATCSWEGWKKHVPRESTKDSSSSDGVQDMVSIGAGDQHENTNQTEHHQREFQSSNGFEKLDIGLTLEERENLGRKCKQLIDKGRVLYLQDNKMTAVLKAYIDQSYTPENIVLLAKPVSR
ncbi:tRNA:m(4)X modification enzyme TRM13 homolog [Liolophura sinensis]|uniref:tRNA:m(4)X modification enzyme TRM13 homolog n=1 Tax=Liolophura sinensis TaxID=3198878 RepID=UPI003159805F